MGTPWISSSLLGFQFPLKRTLRLPSQIIFPLFLNIQPPPPARKSFAPSCQRRIITSTTADEFTAAFRDSQFFALNGMVSPICPDNILSFFHSTCSGILDTIAPFRHKLAKPTTDPWINDNTRTIRQRCRQAERRWKKDKLDVSLDILREAKSQYLSDIISSSSHCPRVLFNTINYFVNPPISALANVSTITCENFLHFFVDKVDSVRQSTRKGFNRDFSVAPTHSAVFEEFELVSFSSLGEIVKLLKPTNCPLDIVPARVLKLFFNIVGPGLVVFINSCLSLGTVPAAFNMLWLGPFLKKLTLTLQRYLILDQFLIFHFFLKFWKKLFSYS